MSSRDVFAMGLQPQVSRFIKNAKAGLVASSLKMALIVAEYPELAFDQVTILEGYSEVFFLSAFFVPFS